MQKKKVLIIDDEPEIMHLTSKLLRAANFDVFCHARGKGALELISHLHPDLILLDIRLPDVSGADIHQALLEDPEIKDIPVIFFSATVNLDGLNLQKPPASVIHKPYELDEFLKTVQLVLSGKTQPKEEWR